MSRRYRNFCFTLNNYTNDEIGILHGSKDRFNYLIYGKEVGDSGTPHLQGYVELKQPTRLTTIKSFLQRAHIEPRYGTAQQASEYCKKSDDNPYIYGEISQQGRRTDLDEISNALIDDKMTVKDICLTYPTSFIKYHKGIEKLRNHVIEPRTEPPTVIVIYGGSGLGKTKYFYDNYKDGYKWEPHQGQWFDGYDGHQNVLFDEFRGQLPFTMLLNLLDRYETKVQYKGGMSQFVAENIVITSPDHPKLWYPNLNERMKQLYRRLTKIIFLYIDNNGSIQTQEDNNPQDLSQEAGSEGDQLCEYGEDDESSSVENI